MDPAAALVPHLKPRLSGAPYPGQKLADDGGDEAPSLRRAIPRSQLAGRILHEIVRQSIGPHGAFISLDFQNAW